MTKTVISIENLSKYYRLGLIGGGTLREDIDRWWARVRGKPDPLLKVGLEDQGSREGGEIWALRDINIEVKEGEILGIIGQNGAGKSTLLKILSRITAPTSGKATIRGRVGSLLEVGTGFHPELTGRENIYLNGTILGMTKQEVSRKLDEIIAFAEMSKFIDTPVKRYSSGMTVRLAFSVAAHLEPEILIVDEVLAVGDIAFQRKCLGKMDDVAKRDGRTVLFVSHNMTSVRALCSRGIVLNSGGVIVNAPVTEAVDLYTQTLQRNAFSETTSVGNENRRRGSGAVRFTDIRVVDESGRETNTFDVGQTIRFVLSFKVLEPARDLHVSVGLRTEKAFDFVTSARHQVSDSRLEAGSAGTVTIEFPENNLRTREYNLYFGLNDSMGRPFDVVDDVLAPILIHSKRTFDQLGYDPANPPGYFDINSKLVESTRSN